MTQRRCMWATEGECGPQGCEGCQYGGAGTEGPAAISATRAGYPVRAFHVQAPSALDEVGYALRGLPAEVAKWWRDGHTLSPWLFYWEGGNHADEGARPLFYADDTETINSYEDYKLWRMLGRVSDVLILVLVLAIVLAVALAI